jgi:hypothetical protein
MYVVQVYEEDKWNDTHPVYPSEHLAIARRDQIRRSLGKKTRIIECIRTLVPDEVNTPDGRQRSIKRR